MTIPRLGAALALSLVALALPVATAAQPASALPAPTCAPVASAVVPVATPVPAADLTVFAAASLTTSFGDLQAPWDARHPGSALVFSFDASSALRAQIEQGAPADVLVAADIKNPQTLVDACLATGLTAFAANRLVIVVPAGNPAGLTTPADLATPGLKVVAAGPDVPITAYAVQAVDNLAALPGYPADFTAAVAANIVSEEDNVKAVLAKIELGEGDAAIVYVTDAASSTAVETVPIPDEANVLAIYAGAAITDATDPALAADFLAFLTEPDAQTILADHGFLPAP